MYFFLGYIKLRTGVTIVAIHTMVQGSLLFLPLFGHSENVSQKKIFSIPAESRLLSGLIASPLLVTGVSLFFASIRPKIGLLDGYIVGTQCIIVLFPLFLVVIYVRTFLETANNSKKIFPGSEVSDAEVFLTFSYICLSASYALASYAILFYNVILVLSFKDEILKELRDANKDEDVYRKRLEELMNRQSTTNS